MTETAMTTTYVTSIISASIAACLAGTQTGVSASSFGSLPLWRCVLMRLAMLGQQYPWYQAQTNQFSVKGFPISLITEENLLTLPRKDS